MKEMDEIIRRIDAFESSEPRICMWCNKAGIVVTALDALDSCVCMDERNVKTQKKGAPTNRAVRSFLKVMEADETCEHWVPTKFGSRRMKLMEACGLLVEGEEK